MILNNIIDFSFISEYTSQFKTWLGTHFINVISGGTSGNLPKINASGKIEDSGIDSAEVLSLDGNEAAANDQEFLVYKHTSSGKKVAQNSGVKEADLVKGATFNGTALTKTNNIIAIPNDLSTFDNSTADFQSGAEVAAAIAQQVASAVNMRGSVSDYAHLPANPAGGDMYNVVSDYTDTSVTPNKLYPGDMNYVWCAPVLYTAEDNIPEGSQVGDVKTPGFWDAQAPTIVINTASTTQIAALFND